LPEAPHFKPPRRLHARSPIYVALALILLTACEDKSAEQTAGQAPPPAVVVAPVTVENVSRRADFVGRTEAFQRVDLRARVKGFLEDIAFVEGGQVRAGDVLFRIDPREFAASVEVAKAEVARAEATLEKETKDLERARTLIQRGNISKSTLDEREAATLRAKADLQAAKAALAQAQLDLDYTEVVAPNSGRIGTSNYDVGNLVGPDSGTLATIVTLNPIYVTFDVDERSFLEFQKRRAKTGESEKVKLRIRLPDGSDFGAPGEVDAISNVVDPTTGTVQVRATFANPDEILLPGQFVILEVASEQTQSKPTIPQSAIQENQQGRFVLVVDAENRVSSRPVETGQRIESRWVIESGLDEGETVIVQGVQKVRPGAEVKPVSAAEAN
jgi:membrane fusion protein (multidrug efflux system)